MNKIPSTYCHGYKLFTTKCITTHDITTLCQLLNEKFNHTLYMFLPEPITEGGIIFKGLESGYKSLRFNVEHLSETQRTKLMKKHGFDTSLRYKWP